MAVFHVFENCSNGTKSDKASHMNKYVGEESLAKYLSIIARVLS